jgi:hypothetical protein
MSPANSTAANGKNPGKGTKKGLADSEKELLAGAGSPRTTQSKQPQMSASKVPAAPVTPQLAVVTQSKKSQKEKYLAMISDSERNKSTNSPSATNTLTTASDAEHSIVDESPTNVAAEPVPLQENDIVDELPTKVLAEPEWIKDDDKSVFQLYSNTHATGDTTEEREEMEFNVIGNVSKAYLRGGGNYGKHNLSITVAEEHLAQVKAYCHEPIALHKHRSKNVVRRLVP